MASNPDKLTANITRRPVGRPRILATPEEALERGMNYFADCDERKEPYLVTGLALALGFCDRHQMSDYEARPEYSHTIKQLRAIVESDYERRQDIKSIFVMKNLGWSDRQDVQLSGVNGGPIQLDSRFEIVLRKPEICDNTSHKYISTPDNCELPSHQTVQAIDTTIDSDEA